MELILFFFITSLLQTSSIDAKKSYIVYLGSHSFGSNPSSYDSELATELHYKLLGRVLGSKVAAKKSMIYSYNRYINGFAAELNEHQAKNLANDPNVVSVLENGRRKLHTTHSWSFLGMENNGQQIPSDSIWKAARFGEDVIIANLDTGVWPESMSFNEEGYGPIPTRWRGICEGGYKFRCNRKLIGARFFSQGYAAEEGSLAASFSTARDTEGHGTHTLTTAGGGFVSGANVFGNGNGTAKGGSPKARVAAYKVCWPSTSGGCYDADILAGFEAAISDGVDVISVSLGGQPQEFSEDAIAIAAFHAVQKGIVVVCSGGNSGPMAGSITNVSPWILTVGASTIDRDFASYVTLGNKKRFKGSSLSAEGLPSTELYPLINSVYAKTDDVSDIQAQFCMSGTLDPAKVQGKIVVCLRGVNGRIEKGFEAARAGAIGMILANNELAGDDMPLDAHLLPASDVSYADGQSIYEYIDSTRVPMGYVSRVQTELGAKPAPIVAAFSSRGPNTIDESILKPDITAPGVKIIAAFTEETSSGAMDQRRSPFQVLSGTSMSCPHIVGVVGLLKTLYPKWSPAAIKSALMTTATRSDNDLQPIQDESTKGPATPFAFGAGHVHPNGAMDPGLVYDNTIEDYLNLLCARGYNQTQINQFANRFSCSQSFKVTDFNYPSISVPNLNSGPVMINRRVKNVGSPSKYTARVKVPRGVSVSVRPKTLEFTKVDEEKAFKVVVKARKGRHQGYVFGTLTWSDGKHYVRSPIAVNLG